MRNEANLPGTIKSRFEDYFSLWKTDRFKFIVYSVSLLVIAISFVLVFLLYLTNRSLWADESTLAYSISTRNLSNLTATYLKNRQSSPVLYVYIVKIITLIGQNTPFFLRIYSFIAYTGTLILTFKILKYMAGVRYPIVGSAFTASMMIMLYYANEFKQYMSDGFTVLIVIYLYHLQTRRKLSLLALLGIYAILLWLSFPAIFFIGGIAIDIFIRNIILKRWKDVRQTIYGSVAILGSFTLQYFYWLKTSSENPKTVEHWVMYKFPIIPTSFADVIRAARLIYGVALSLNQYPVVQNTLQLFPVIVVLLVMIGSLSIIKKRNATVEIILVSIFLLMAASFIGKYPFHPRLILFIYPILSILIIIGIDFLQDLPRRKSVSLAVAAILIAGIFAGNATSLQFFKYENRLRINEESKPLIQYVQENIRQDEYVYVHGADMNLSYLNGYDNLHIGRNIGNSIENIRFGGLDFSEGSEMNLADFKAANSYIIISHANLDLIDSLIQPLQKYGYIEKILDVAQTPLYYHARDLASVKTSAEYRLHDLKWTGNAVSGQISITNTGKSILNAAGLAELQLASRTITGYILPIDQHDIQPGEMINVEFSMNIPDGVKSADLQLQYPDQYWFDEIGVPPVNISRNAA